MSVLRVVEPVEPPVSDPVVARLDDLLVELAAIVADSSPVGDADRIDRLDRLERARAAIAAVQTAEMVRFPDPKSPNNWPRTCTPNASVKASPTRSRCLPDIALGRFPTARDGPSIVVRPAADLLPEAMFQAWFKSVVLTVVLWSRPYVEDRW